MYDYSLISYLTFYSVGFDIYDDVRLEKLINLLFPVIITTYGVILQIVLLCPSTAIGW